MYNLNRKKNMICITIALSFILLLFSCTIKTVYLITPDTHLVNTFTTETHEMDIFGFPLIDIKVLSLNPNSFEDPSYITNVIYATDMSFPDSRFDIWSANLKLASYGDDNTTKYTPFLYDETSMDQYNKRCPIVFLKNFSFDTVYNVLDETILDKENVYLFASDNLTDTNDTSTDMNIYFYNKNIGLKLFSANSQYSDMYPCYDYKRQTLYFASNRGDGIHYNIYKYKNNTGSDDFENLLSNINEDDIELATDFNSSFNDTAPYIYDDTIVFSSDRTGGSGGYDIYYSNYENGVWSNPAPMDINTPSNELRPTLYKPKSGSAISNKLLMYSSDRKAYYGNDNDVFNLYYYVMPEDF